MTEKICNLCGGVIPKEKIEEFESKFKAQESEIRKNIEQDLNEKLLIEKRVAEERINQQKQLFEDFKKDLKKQYEEDRLRISKEFENISEEKLKNKENELSSIKSKLKEAESEIEKIGNKAENKYKLQIEELQEKLNSNNKKWEREVEEREELNKALQKKDEKIINLQKENTENTEKLKSEYEEKLRKLENKTPSELGEEGQEEVLDILNRAFPKDNITETKKGKSGSDIFHKIIYNGEEIGLIVYEVKNVSNWNNDFIDQVKEDRTNHYANYALLVSNIFPSKEKIISEKEGVIIVHPTKVAIIAREIRNFLIEAYKAKLSGEEIEEKTKILQEYLISSEYKTLLFDLFNSIKGWHDIRYKEKISHERHWAEEEKLNNKISEKTAKIHAKIASIIESKIMKIQHMNLTQSKKKKTKKIKY